MTQPDLYLNHAGTSWPKPHAVAVAVQEAMSVAPVGWAQRFDDAHQAIAEFFGVRRCEELLLTPGCTSSLAVGIGDALIPSGKRVLTSRWEHHALHRPLLKRTLGDVRVDYIPPSKTAFPAGQACSIDLNWLERALAEQDVGLIAITAVCNVTGERLPYEDVIRMAQKCGVMVLIDAAQLVGWDGTRSIAIGRRHGRLWGPQGIAGALGHRRFVPVGSRANGVRFRELRSVGGSK